MRTLRFVITLLFLLTLPLTLVAAQDDMMDHPPLGFWEDCETPDSLSGTVSLGAIFGLSGPISVYGGPQRQAVELAVMEINDSGYLGEASLEVIFEDAQGDAEQAISAMTKLVEEDGVVGVIGPTLSTQAFSADPIAEENSTPVMGVSNTAVGITDMGDYVFRNSLPESAVIPGTVAQAVDALGLQAVGVMYGSDDDFTYSGYEVFVEALDANDVRILGEETFSVGDVDFSAQLTNLINEDPDALVVSALASEAALIIIQARDLGYEGTIIGGNGFNSPAVRENAGTDAEGVIVGAAWNSAATSQTPSSLAFIEHFEAAYEFSPDQFATQAYTGTWLYATAIRCANSTDRTAVRDALAGITDFDSPLGSFSFDENRDPLHDPVAQIIIDGAFMPLGLAIEEGLLDD